MVMGAGMHPRRRGLAPFVLPGLVLITGCSLLVDTREPSRTGPCSADSDCPALEICIQSACQPVCERDSDCATGETCQPLRGAAACELAVRVNVRADGGVEAGSSVPQDASVPEEGERGGDASEEPRLVGALDASSDVDGGGGAPFPLICSGAEPSRAVLFGGQSGVDYLSDTWVFDGTASTWTEQPMGDDDDPSARWSGATAAICGGMFLFSGGDMSPAYVDDQWTWQGGAWAVQTPSTQPPARLNASVAALNGKLVLFGGYEPDYTTFADTWVWDGRVWTQQKPVASPPGRAGAAMANVGGVVMLFGGDDGTGTPLPDTWLWDGATWTQAHPASSPPARYWATTSAFGTKAVLFGGFDSYNALDDTWTWDGQVWTQEQPAASPTARDLAASAGDDHELILFGGQDTNGILLGDTWTWDGTNWTKLEVTGPSARTGPMMAGF
jgi:hypothetical protein